MENTPNEYINISAVHQDYRQTYRDLRFLLDNKGKAALKPAHLQIVACIGSFSKAKGCFMRDVELNKNTIRSSSMKTLKLNLKYLEHVGVLKRTVENNRRVYRIACPAGPVQSQVEFRADRGMHEYAYTKKRAKTAKNEGAIINGAAMETLKPIEDGWDASGLIAPEKEALFSAKIEENFSVETTDFSTPGANFAPVLRTNCILTEKKEKLPPYPLRQQVPEVEFVRDFEVRVPDSVHAGSLREPVGATNDRRPHGEAPQAPRTGEYPFQIFSKKTTKPEESGDNGWDELLPRKKRGTIKTPATQRERRAEALKRMNNGHVANPLGGPNCNPRRLNPKVARDIGPKGAVTVSQLFRHLIKLYDTAFGEGIVGNMMPTSKDGVSSWFDDLRQKFIQACQYEPSNRELAEYFEWFLEPKRVQQMLAGAKYSAGKGFVHLKQIEGAVYIRRFHDEVLKLRKQRNYEPSGNATVRETELSEMEAFIDKVYAALKGAEQVGDEIGFTLKMVGCGYALTAQYLHDSHGLDDSHCRQKIVALMTHFLKHNEDKKWAVEFLRKGVTNTAKCKVFLVSEKCIWYNWEEKVKDLVDIAIQQSGITIDG